MNYLAHAYLSFNNEDLLVGNMISDYIKGRNQFDFPAVVQAGIQLHRAIDEFTDTHITTLEIKKLFKPTYRLYAGAFIDVLYDYFLANDKNEFFSSDDLANFSKNTYQLLNNASTIFPEKFATIFPYMQSQNWLYNYRTDDGIYKSLGGLARRSKYIAEINTAFDIFLKNKNELEASYNEFFPALKKMALLKIETLLNNINQ